MRLGDGEAHGIGNALAQGAGGGFHAHGVHVFGVARGLAAQLAELLQVVNRQAVAKQVQQGIDQHAAVAGGKHKAITIQPVGVGAVVLHVAAP